MPISYAVDTDLEVVFVHQWGIVTERDLLALAEAVKADARVPPEWRSLTDARQVQDMRVGGAFLRGYRSAFTASAPRAVVVGDTLAFGMSRMYGLAKGAETNVHVCYDPAEALEWLGLSADTPIPGRGEALGAPVGSKE